MDKVGNFEIMVRASSMSCANFCIISGFDRPKDSASLAAEIIESPKGCSAKKLQFYPFPVSLTNSLFAALLMKIPNTDSQSLLLKHFPKSVAKNEISPSVSFSAWFSSSGGKWEEVPKAMSDPFGNCVIFPANRQSSAYEFLLRRGLAYAPKTRFYQQKSGSASPSVAPPLSEAKNDKQYSLNPNSSNCHHRAT